MATNPNRGKTLTEADLTPPDLKQCEAEKPNGHTFMTLRVTPADIQWD
jgi:hypothetical protein